jgi:hypothetical protein
MIYFSLQAVGIDLHTMHAMTGVLLVTQGPERSFSTAVYYESEHFLPEIL